MQSITELPPLEELKDPTPEQRQYIIERWLMVRDPESRRMVPFVANPMQADIIQTLRPREITLKSRRAGLTSIYVAEALLDTCLKSGTNTELYAHNDDTARKIFEQVVLPQYLSLPDEVRPTAHRASVRELYFADLDSSFSVDTVGQSQRIAESKGQARTIHNLLLTEFAFYAYAEDFYEKISSCVPKGGKIRMDSTPNGLNSFYARFTEAMEGHSEYRARFYPWWWDAKNQLPIDDGETITFREEEKAIGKDNPLHDGAGLSSEQVKWRRWKMADLQPRGHLTVRDVFVTEYPEDPQSCFLHSGRPLFLPSDLVKRTDPKDPVLGHDYAIGHDSSAGSAGGHPCGTVVLDLTTGEQVYAKRAWDPIEVQAARLLSLQQKYNHALIIPERNFPGDAVIALLRRDMTEMLYYHHDKEMKEHDGQPSKRKPGFPMTATTKPRLFTDLQLALGSSSLKLCDLDTIADLKGFQYDDNDRIVFQISSDPSVEASHGDLGIAIALAWYARKSGGPGVG